MKQAAKTETPNIILITIDCLRADHLSCLGYPRKTTPNLDYLATKGVLFSQAISVGPWTPPSFIGILTSTYPLMYGGELYIANWRTTVAQVLKEHRYHTAAFHSNPWVSSYHGYQQGFGTFDDSAEKVSHKLLLSGGKELAKRIVGTKGRLYDFLSAAYTTLITGDYVAKGDELNEKAIRWLHDNSSSSFLWLHYMYIHEPYYQPSKKDSSPFERYRHWKLNKKAKDAPGTLLPGEVNELIDLYDAKISYVDRIIGSLLHTLKQSNILNNTFIVITADHGQQFMEHGGYAHGFNLYDELIHVPLIIIGPGLPKRVIGQQVSLLDLAPTILDMLKIRKPETFLGNSLLPLIMDKTKASHPTAISEDGVTRASFRAGFFTVRPKLSRTARLISLRTGKWKYIYNEVKQDELYCLEDDPKETQNIIADQPEIATELRAKIMAHIEFEDRSAPGETELIKAKITKLKGSGKI